MNGDDAAERDVVRIFRDALDADAGVERERFLDRRCGGDASLRARVESLLRSAVDADDEDADATAAGDAGVRDGLLGTTLGAFRLVERIGRGGMGVVYRGVREGGDFAHEAALKLIRRGFDFDDIRARFLRERRILARLSHPNLARFIDGGVAPDGRPWFALEFVRGAAITRWCDARRLGVRARVRLFLDVCAAVQYAHAQLVVHRDLKPANVLVDNDGHIRLLDFGIARLVGGD
jgi:serine/threonine-protein kinase